MALSFAHMVTFSACLTFLLLVSSFEAAPHERYMYSMGLGKRLYSPYSFGLGKRGGSDRHRFAFGLGKRSSGDVYSEPTDMDEGVVVDRDEDADYWMEEEKRASRPSVYSFGLGKRAKPQQDRSYYSFGLGKREVPLTDNSNPVAQAEPSQVLPAAKGQHQ